MTRDNGLTSFGYKPTTVLDAANNVITDPKKADRNYNKKLNYTILWLHMHSAKSILGKHESCAKCELIEYEFVKK